MGSKRDAMAASWLAIGSGGRLGKEGLVFWGSDGRLVEVERVFTIGIVAALIPVPKELGGDWEVFGWAFLGSKLYRLGGMDNKCRLKDAASIDLAQRQSCSAGFGSRWIPENQSKEVSQDGSTYSCAWWKHKSHMDQELLNLGALMDFQLVSINKLLLIRG
ncbi:hypothetical protein O6P43_030220 [Quillaja saponaria]|uniref:Uncharacterized protein n=1 Tax=Quillaja saponaria TaxID=32244 RepID=A0AAD7L225_QUISA|nr:hypothetical protein O6P43_030220 [Quillaja saponaria]